MSGKTDKQLAIFALIEEYNEEHGIKYNPIREMIDMGLDKLVDEHIRFNAHKEVAAYMYPKRRAEDEQGNPGNDYTIQIMNYTNNIIEGKDPQQIVAKQYEIPYGKPLSNETGEVIDLKAIERENARLELEERLAEESGEVRDPDAY